MTTAIAATAITGQSMPQSPTPAEVLQEPLLIENQLATHQAVGDILISNGFSVTTAKFGEEGFDLASIYDYDIILLDLRLPDISGHEVLRRLRRSDVQTAAMILAETANIADKLRSLDLADDYMTKPVHADEFVARIRAIVRRANGYAQSCVRIGDLILNLNTKVVDVNGKPIALTGKEYQVLELLALRKGITLTKEMFLNHLYGGIDEPDSQIIDVFICKLRKKLAAAGSVISSIETVRGRGYTLCERKNASAAAA